MNSYNQYKSYIFIFCIVTVPPLPACPKDIAYDIDRLTAFVRPSFANKIRQDLLAEQ
jgi:hypothetical protein